MDRKEILLKHLKGVRAMADDQREEFFEEGKDTEDPDVKLYDRILYSIDHVIEYTDSCTYIDDAFLADIEGLEN